MNKMPVLRDFSGQFICFFLFNILSKGFGSQTGIAGASENCFDGIPDSSVKRPQELFQEVLLRNLKKMKQFLVSCFAQPIIPVWGSAGS